MKKAVIIFFLFLGTTFAQADFRAVVISFQTKEPISGAIVSLVGTEINSSSNSEGYVELKKIPHGTYDVIFFAIGYKKFTRRFDFPLRVNQVFEIFLETSTLELNEIHVEATRYSRLIDDEPTRVEVIASEELDEKMSMEPSQLSMILNESTGITVQQTSASSVNSSFRIQGLNGRYTQLLRDGIPLFGGYAGSLSINQILPLDLQQIEIIKGSSSTLYGGGAIAGLINLISKKPNPEGETLLLTNVTSAQGLDLSAFTSKQERNFGYTFFTSGNFQNAYDNNDDNFSDLPRIQKFTIRPIIFIKLLDRITLEIGAAYQSEDRFGGSIPVIKNQLDPNYTFFERNRSDRLLTTFNYSWAVSKNHRYVLRNGISFFERKIELRDFSFSANTVNTFTEASYHYDRSDDNHWIFGSTLYSETYKFEDSLKKEVEKVKWSLGFFAQNNRELSENLFLESGLRIDYDSFFDIFILPRFSLLMKLGDGLTSRIGGGLGYISPSMFTDEAEKIYYKDLLQINTSKVKAEKSFGLNADIDYKKVFFDELAFSINQLFFYTRVNDPMMLSTSTKFPSKFEYTSLNGFYATQGFETNLKLQFDEIKMFVGYTFTDAKSNSAGSEQEFFLTPKHKLGIILMYEKEDNLRIGLEGYHTSKQKISSATFGNAFWIFGIMAEKKFANFSIFLNFENITETRQSKFTPMFSGSTLNPNFAEVYAPTDGRIINGGIKVFF